jgi:hypothetical protein
MYIICLSTIANIDTNFEVMCNELNIPRICTYYVAPGCLISTVHPFSQDTKVVKVKLPSADHEGILAGRGIGPFILNFSTGWM